MNKIGLDINAVGNHEFDEGVYELMRMQFGGCHPTDGCQDGDAFAGADFGFLAANVTWKYNHKPIFPAYKVLSFGGVKIAVVGLVTRTTPTIVTPTGISMVDFADEADTMNALIPKLRKQGIQTVVGLIHEGGLPTGLYNECPGISGAIVDIVERANDEVDLWLSGHTHTAYNCVIDGDPVSSGSSFGRIVTDVDMKISKKTGEPTSITVDNEIVTRTVAKDADQTALIAKYKTLSAPLANREVGNITADVTRTNNAVGESSLGNLIADSQLLATKPAALGGAVIALMNPGGIRADMVFAKSGPEAVDGIVRYEEIFTVQPFGNSLVTMTLTGQQIDTVLEQQFGNPAAGQSRILSPSASLTYTYSLSAPVGSKVDISTIKIDGTPISAGTSYRVTVNSFLATGGDNFLELANGTNRLGGAVDLDAVEEYFDAQSGPVAPPAQNRITTVP
jgi:5'-nucleotidase